MFNNKVYYSKRLIPSLIICLTLLCIPNISYAITTVTFIPQWRPQAQFAGFYVAYKKGFYKKYGLNVIILTGGPDAPSTVYLKEGKATFATMWLSTAIQMKANGVNLINIAQLFQRSSLTIVGWRSEIKNIKDLNGKKIGVWEQSFMIPLKAFLKKYNLKVKLIPHMGSINLFLRKGVDAATAMWYNEYNTIINSGVQPNQLTIFWLYKYGLNFPEDGIYVLEKTYKKHKNICINFVKASIQGWIYAFNHPKEAIDIVIKYMTKAHVPANLAHQEWMLNAIKKSFLFRGYNNIGNLNKKDYYRVAKILEEEKLIKKIPSFNSFYKDCYSAKNNIK